MKGAVWLRARPAAMQSRGHCARVSGAPARDVTPEGAPSSRPGRDRAPQVVGAASCPGAGPAYRPGRGCRGQPCAPHLATHGHHSPGSHPRGTHRQVSSPPPTGRTHKAPLRPWRCVTDPHIPTPRWANTRCLGARRAPGPIRPSLPASPRHHSTSASRTNPSEDPAPRRRAPPPCSSPDGHPVTSRTPPRHTKQ